MKKKKLIIIPALIILFSMILISPTKAAILSDLDETAWYYDTVNSFIERGIVNGYSDGTFRPNETITYGEFYKLVAISANLEITEDDRNTHWAQKYAKAVRYFGDSNVTTIPAKLDNKIPRKDAIRSLMISFGVKETVDSKHYEYIPFSDMPRRDVWELDGHIMNAYHLGIITGWNGMVYPNDEITRAEAVAIIERALNVENWTLPEPEILNGINIMYVGKYATSFKDDICYAISKYPKYIVEKFIEDKLTIVITDENSNKYYDGPVKSEISGMYYPGQNKIIIFTKGNPASLFFGIEETLVHELGHYVYYNVISEEDKNNIINIFNEGIEPKELSKILYSDYCETNAGEFFAELTSHVLSNKKFPGEGEIPKSQAIAEKYFKK